MYVGSPTRRGDPLEPALDGNGDRLCALDDPSHLARLWSAATSHGDVQAVYRSPVCGKVRDIVGLYLAPPDRAAVLCFDEKTQVQALDRTQPLLPMRPGQVERHTHDYTRCGTTSLFAALDVKLGTIIGGCFPRHRAVEFRRFLDQVERSVPSDLDIHVIIDNAGSTMPARTRPS